MQVGGYAGQASVPSLLLHGLHQVHPPRMPRTMAEVLQEGVLRALQL